MKPTHKHSANNLDYHFNGTSWWYYSPTYQDWMPANFIVIDKMVAI